eukprot:TRINITY_DN25598_c0_g1_i1.p1 TRINITY_DN25598_c0_g1~~TRINITY_DN25598_c0_g1_i1.p1  ORF type:complete len:260 (-),score=53.42 TRINITY_DN25598_c0_g1_i1:107-886(-)
MFRSVPMSRYSLMMARENAWETVARLGRLSTVHFVDQNTTESGFARPYAGAIRRVEELEAKLKIITTEMGRFGIEVKQVRDASWFLSALERHLQGRGQRSESLYFGELEAELETRLASLNEQLRGYNELLKKRNELKEFKEVLSTNREFIKALRGGSAKVSHYNISGVGLSVIAGTIEKSDSQRFKRMIFRVTRGNTWTVLSEVESWASEDKETAILKDVFMILLQSDAQNLRAKLEKMDQDTHKQKQRPALDWKKLER